MTERYYAVTFPGNRGDPRFVRTSSAARARELAAASFGMAANTRTQSVTRLSGADARSARLRAFLDDTRDPRRLREGPGTMLARSLSGTPR